LRRRPALMLAVWSMSASAKKAQSTELLDELLVGR
jgi:hypothetical protein